MPEICQCIFQVALENVLVITQYALNDANASFKVLSLACWGPQYALKDANAFFYLGVEYYEGGRYGLPQDVNKAMDLWNQAAELGSMSAHYFLGNTYYSREEFEDETEGDDIVNSLLSDLISPLILLLLPDDFVFGFILDIAFKRALDAASSLIDDKLAT